MAVGTSEAANTGAGIRLTGTGVGSFWNLDDFFQSSLIDLQGLELEGCASPQFVVVTSVCASDVATHPIAWQLGQSASDFNSVGNNETCVLKFPSNRVTQCQIVVWL